MKVKHGLLKERIENNEVVHYAENISYEQACDIWHLYQDKKYELTNEEEKFRFAHFAGKPNREEVFIAQLDWYPPSKEKQNNHKWCVKFYVGESND